MVTRPRALTSELLADGEEGAVAPNPLVPLNFRVPADFREEFETYAFNSKPRRKMVALLKDAFAALKDKEGAKAR